jgi:uncharacterized protein YcsI (UPF0317 family)
MNPREIRTLIRKGDLAKPTAGMAPGYVQANLVVVPKDWAFEFLLFCYRNPKPCPVLDITDVGSPQPTWLGPDIDLRTDLPKYRVYRSGTLEAEVTQITDQWQDDLVAFLLGCSYTFESALMLSGIPIRHIEEGCNVPMYTTNIQCAPAGRLQGPTVVSMRPIPCRQVMKAVEVTARFPKAHGTPMHIGDPTLIGIRDLGKPDYGDPVTVKHGEVPVFWGCGVTPQAVVTEARPELMITHAPGHMLITDRRYEELATS